MDTLANAAAELADIVDDVSGPQDEEDDASMSYSEPEDNLPPGYYKETSNAQQGDAPFSMPGHSCGAYKAMQSHVEVRGKRVNVKRRGKHGPVTRRPVQYWSAFNDWWRGIYEVSGKRPTGCDIDAWHRAHAAGVWPAGHAPSVEETRTHAKCLRSVGSIRNYFRNYRARKRVHGEQADYEGQAGHMAGPNDGMLQLLHALPPHHPVLAMHPHMAHSPGLTMLDLSMLPASPPLHGSPAMSPSMAALALSHAQAQALQHVQAQAQMQVALSRLMQQAGHAGLMPGMVEHAAAAAQAHPMQVLQQHVRQQGGLQQQLVRGACQLQGPQRTPSDNAMAGQAPGRWFRDTLGMSSNALGAGAMGDREHMPTDGSHEQCVAVAHAVRMQQQQRLSSADSLQEQESDDDDSFEDSEEQAYAQGMAAWQADCRDPHRPQTHHRDYFQFPHQHEQQGVSAPRPSQSAAKHMHTHESLQMQASGQPGGMHGSLAGPGAAAGLHAGVHADGPMGQKMSMQDMMDSMGQGTDGCVMLQVVGSGCTSGSNRQPAQAAAGGGGKTGSERHSSQLLQKECIHDGGGGIVSPFEAAAVPGLCSPGSRSGVNRDSTAAIHAWSLATSAAPMQMPGLSHGTVTEGMSTSDLQRPQHRCVVSADAGSMQHSGDSGGRMVDMGMGISRGHSSVASRLGQHAGVSQPVGQMPLPPLPAMQSLQGTQLPSVVQSGMTALDITASHPYTSMDHMPPARRLSTVEAYQGHSGGPGSIGPAVLPPSAAPLPAPGSALKHAHVQASAGGGSGGGGGGEGGGMRGLLLKGLQTCGEAEARALLEDLPRETLLDLVVGALALARVRTHTQTQAHTHTHTQMQAQTHSTSTA